MIDQRISTKRSLEAAAVHRALTGVVLAHNTRCAMADLVTALFTPEERQELIQRIRIVRLIKAGLPQREIARRLGVGVATVTRGAREVRQGHFRNL